MRSRDRRRECGGPNGGTQSRQEDRRGRCEDGAARRGRRRLRILGVEQSAAALRDASFGRKRLRPSVEDAVDEERCCRGGVVFRDVDGLVERHLHGDVGNDTESSVGRSEDQVVHEHDAFHVPVAREAVHVFEVRGVVHQRALEERLRECEVVVVS